MDEKKFPKARSLTNIEMDEMRKAGVNPIFLGKEEREAKNPALIRAEMADWLAKNIYKTELPAVYPNGKLMRLTDETFMLSLGKEEGENEEIKNS